MPIVLSYVQTHLKRVSAPKSRADPYFSSFTLLLNAAFFALQFCLSNGSLYATVSLCSHSSDIQVVSFYLDHTQVPKDLKRNKFQCIIKLAGKDFEKAQCPVKHCCVVSSSK